MEAIRAEASLGLSKVSIMSNWGIPKTTLYSVLSPDYRTIEDWEEVRAERKEERSEDPE